MLQGQKLSQQCLKKQLYQKGKKAQERPRQRNEIENPAVQAGLSKSPCWQTEIP